MKKIVISLIFTIIFVMFLSSCSKQIHDYTIAYSDFRYDNDISWNSSYSDIEKKYGKPTCIREATNIEYENISICGHNGFLLSFGFNKNSGRLSHIMLFHYADTDSLGKTVYNDVVKGMTSKYGKAFKQPDSLLYKWDNQIEDTRIFCDYGEYSSKYVTSITYLNSHDDSTEPTNNDLPTTPIPTATPTPRTDGL